MAKSGMFNNMSRQDILQKLKESGISEEEALQFAKDNNIDLNKLPGKNKTQTLIPPQTQTQNQNQSLSLDSLSKLQGRQISQPANQEKDELTDSTKQPPSLPADTTKIPKGVFGLDYFGYSVFKNIPAAFEPTAVGPVDPGYVLGPDDVIHLSVWGQTEFQYELIVDFEGKIFIPGVGQVSVTGIPLRDLETKLKNQLSKYYSGLASSPPTVFLDVTISKLRPLRVFVMGEVNHPGGYTISSFATVFNALYSVGGPTVNGSLRTVKVLRENKLIATVDLYDYLTRGDKSSDVRLQNNDVIFVPVRGKTVAIRGEVKKPAIYELKEDEQFQELLQYCGNLRTTAYTGRAEIDRTLPFEERKEGMEDLVVVSVDLTSMVGKGGKNEPLVDGDAITIFSIASQAKNFISITGAVWHSGKFELGKIKTLYDLVKATGGTQPEAYLKKVDIHRIRPDSTREFLTFSLEKVMMGESSDNTVLQGQDSVHVYSIHETQFDKTLSISGHIKNPQTLPYSDSITLYDLVFQSGGLLDSFYRKETFLLRGDIFRLNENKISRRIIAFDLERLMSDSSYKIPLEPNDEVVIYPIDVSEILDKYVVISGEVKKPGKFLWRSNLDIQSLILEAGGFTEEAEISQAEVARIAPRGLTNDSLVILLHPKIVEDLSQPKQDFFLQYHDHVTIRRNPNFTFHKNVKIVGDITHPGVYSLQRKGERLSEIIARADGPTSTSYLNGASLTRGGKRLNVDFAIAFYKKEQQHDVPLLPGDSIYVPSKPNTVFVIGEVNNPGLYSFLEGNDVDDYISRAGGQTDSSDNVLLQKPSGETELQAWHKFDSNVPDGSTIIVTKEKAVVQEVKPLDLGGTIKDVFAILSSAATLVFLIYQLKK